MNSGELQAREWTHHEPKADGAAVVAYQQHFSVACFDAGIAVGL